MTAYCTEAEADVYLALDFDNWPSLTSAQKVDALDWGRVYIDYRFTCLDADGEAYDDTTAPDALKHANAVAANLHSQNLLLTSETAVSSKEVKAGTVSSKTVYATGGSSSTKDEGIQQIDMLLDSLCTSIRGASATLVRV